ncbi:hypothetical protein HXX76_005618 [Chlamydomonas incerta]|uniref:Uncharacterized protein n=1 Tax=Chlamydomonas incerta TaxID=51695 RepID=A0A835TCT4_CHLIN|nr:hypothetical protein HXX76_005618 [Chlamydomonas incerta]|eukprot:KAG2438004.1 hypothetical protein HXX76_005618 [Chlamydomonas incerta]
MQVFGYAQLAKPFCAGTAHTLPLGSTLAAGFPCSGSVLQQMLYLAARPVQVFQDYLTLQRPDRWVSASALGMLARLLLAAAVPASVAAPRWCMWVFPLQRIVAPATLLVLLYTADVEPSALSLWFMRSWPVSDCAYALFFQTGFVAEAVYGVASFLISAALGLRIRAHALRHQADGAGGDGASAHPLAAQLLTCAASTAFVLYVQLQRRAQEDSRRRRQGGGESELHDVRQWARRSSPDRLKLQGVLLRLQRGHREEAISAYMRAAAEAMAEEPRQPWWIRRLVDPACELLAAMLMRWPIVARLVAGLQRPISPEAAPGAGRGREQLPPGQGKGLLPGKGAALSELASAANTVTVDATCTSTAGEPDAGPAPADQPPRADPYDGNTVRLARRMQLPPRPVPAPQAQHPPTAAARPEEPSASAYQAYALATKTVVAGATVGDAVTATADGAEVAEPEAGAEAGEPALPDAGRSRRPTYVPRVRLQRRLVKIKGAAPEQVAAGYEARVAAAVAAAGFELEGVYLRRGCVELVINARRWLHTEHGGAADGAEAALAQAALADADLDALLAAAEAEADAEAEAESGAGAAGFSGMVTTAGYCSHASAAGGGAGAGAAAAAAVQPLAATAISSPCGRGFAGAEAGGRRVPQWSPARVQRYVVMDVRQAVALAAAAPPPPARGSAAPADFQTALHSTVGIKTAAAAAVVAAAVVSDVGVDAALPAQPAPAAAADEIVPAEPACAGGAAGGGDEVMDSAGDIDIGALIRALQIGDSASYSQVPDEDVFELEEPQPDGAAAAAGTAAAPAPRWTTPTTAAAVAAEVAAAAAADAGAGAAAGAGATGVPSGPGGGGVFGKPEPPRLLNVCPRVLVVDPAAAAPAPVGAPVAGPAAAARGDVGWRDAQPSSDGAAAPAAVVPGPHRLDVVVWWPPEPAGSSGVFAGFGGSAAAASAAGSSSQGGAGSATGGGSGGGAVEGDQLELLLRCRGLHLPADVVAVMPLDVLPAAQQATPTAADAWRRRAGAGSAVSRASRDDGTDDDACSGDASALTSGGGSSGTADAVDAVPTPVSYGGGSTPYGCNGVALQYSLDLLYLPLQPGLLLVEAGPAALVPVVLLRDAAAAAELQAVADAWSGSPDELNDLLHDVAAFAHEAADAEDAAAAAVPVAAALPVAAAGSSRRASLVLSGRAVSLGNHLLSFALRSRLPAFSHMLRRSLTAARAAAASAVSAPATVPSTAATPSPFNTSNPSTACSAATPRTSRTTMGARGVTDTTDLPDASACGAADCHCPPSASCGCNTRRAEAAAAAAAEQQQHQARWWPLRAWLLPPEAVEEAAVAQGKQGKQSGSRLQPGQLAHEMGGCHCGCARNQLAPAAVAPADSSAGSVGAPAAGAAAAALVTQGTGVHQEGHEVPAVAAHLMQWTDVAIAALAVVRLLAAAASGGAMRAPLSAAVLDLVAAAGGVLCAVSWARQPREAWMAAVRRAVLPRQVLGLAARLLAVLPGMPLPAARVRYELGAGVWLLEGLALPAVSLASPAAAAVLAAARVPLLARGWLAAASAAGITSVPSSDGDSPLAGVLAAYGLSPLLLQTAMEHAAGVAALSAATAGLCHWAWARLRQRGQLQRKSV